MIVVDSSAVVAILFGEPSSPALLARLAADPDRVISAASYLEAGTVLAGRRQSARLRAIDDLDAFLDEAGIALAPVDLAQARLALRAHPIWPRHGAWRAAEFRRCVLLRPRNRAQGPVAVHRQRFRHGRRDRGAQPRTKLTYELAGNPPVSLASASPSVSTT